ncbi:hypothetical protein CXQ81_17575 [Pseudomonas sp. 09C 129]|nr:hypothetical protein CXQ81_17575 [Pseudomonas sp. 09C 129]
MSIADSRTGASATADQDLCVLVQIETQAALDKIEEVATESRASTESSLPVERVDIRSRFVESVV